MCVTDVRDDVAGVFGHTAADDDAAAAVDDAENRAAAAAAKTFNARENLLNVHR